MSDGRDLARCGSGSPGRRWSARRGERDWWLLDETVAANARGRDDDAAVPVRDAGLGGGRGRPGLRRRRVRLVRAALRRDASRRSPTSPRRRCAATGRAERSGSTHRALPYRPIEIWQIWNEPNLSSFYRPAVDPIGYAALVEAGAAAIRSQDPDATVLLAGLTGTRTNAKRRSTTAFLTQLYSVPEIAASFDGIAVHPYNRKARRDDRPDQGGAGGRHGERGQRRDLGDRGRLGVGGQAAVGPGEEPRRPGEVAAPGVHAADRGRPAPGASAPSTGTRGATPSRATPSAAGARGRACSTGRAAASRPTSSCARSPATSGRARSAARPCRSRRRGCP